MRSGEGGPWRPWPNVPAWRRLAFVVVLLAGCAQTRPHVDQAVKADQGGVARNEGVAEQYLIRCPDVLQVTVDGLPDLPPRAAVGPDGRLDRDDLGQPRVEGQTTDEAALAVAAALAVPPGAVRLRVAEYNSQQVYLFGEVLGLHRAVAYQGPETVLDLLQRVGGITPEAAEGDIHVIRSHVAEGHDPEVFHIDLRAIAVTKDRSTSLRLRPFDQVYVGQTRRAVIDHCMPPWLRPAYEAVFGMRRKP
jgi:protein involved in polysaccharide export with SLBB domain